MFTARYGLILYRNQITFRLWKLNIIPLLCCRPNTVCDIGRICSAFSPQEIFHVPSLYILKHFSVRFVVYYFSFCLSCCLQPQLLSSFTEIELQPSNANNPSDVITCRIVFLKNMKPSLFWTPSPFSVPQRFWYEHQKCVSQMFINGSS